MIHPPSSTWCGVARASMQQCTDTRRRQRLYFCNRLLLEADSMRVLARFGLVRHMVCTPLADEGTEVLSIWLQKKVATSGGAVADTRRAH